MKCINCGWDNPDGAVYCEKCRSRIKTWSDSVVEPVRRQPSAAPAPVHAPSPKDDNLAERMPVTCAKCGYPMSPRSRSCPNCNSLPATAGAGKAVRQCPGCSAWLDETDNYCRNCGEPLDESAPVMRPPQQTPGHFTLTPLQVAGSPMMQPAQTVYSGPEVKLNRRNLDPDDTDLDPECQAILTHDGKEWTIKGERDTYLALGRKTALADGDILILGNRAYKFNLNANDKQD